MRKAILLLMCLLTATTQAQDVTARQYYPVRDRLEVTSLDGTWQFKIDGSTE